MYSSAGFSSKRDSADADLSLLDPSRSRKGALTAAQKREVFRRSTVGRRSANIFRRLTSLATKSADNEVEAAEAHSLVRYRPESLQKLCQSTAFTRKEIQTIYRGFKEGCPSGIVDLDKFKEIYAQFFPRGGDSTNYAAFIFNTFDRDHNGQISFDEFVVGLSILSRGNTEEKLRWMFALYDVDNDGFVSREDVTKVVLAVYELIGRREHDSSTIAEHACFVHQRLTTATEDQQVTLEEFVSACSNDQGILLSLGLFDTMLEQHR